MEIRERIAQEEEVREKTDKEGSKWLKLYFGGGAHFRNWLSQIEEIYGKENIEIEEIDPSQLDAYHHSQEYNPSLDTPGCHLAPVDPVKSSVPPPTVPTTSNLYHSLHDFQKSVKHDITLYQEFKHECQWDKYN